jgi:pimeloyl-ACP methyl ester carboxylesterase
MLTTLSLTAALTMSSPAGSSSPLPTAPQVLALDDGRELAWIEVGDPTGHPVMFFHGGADSRLEAHLIAGAAARLGVRLIAPDRTGFGASSPQPGRQLTDWPADVIALADHLGLEGFEVAGHSGGGPHALVVAAALPERVSRVAVVAGAAPAEAGAAGMVLPFRIGRWLSMRWPSMHRRLLEQHRGDLEQPERFLAQYGRLSRGDGALFAAEPEAGERLVADMIEGYRQGVDAAWEEAQLYYSDWGFPLDSVRQPVALFYGDDDANVAPGWGPWLAARLPDATLVTLPGEGHISALVHHADGLFSALLRVGPVA